MTSIRNFAADEGGAAAIQHCLVVALISIAIIAVLASVSFTLVTKFTTIWITLK